MSIVLNVIVPTQLLLARTAVRANGGGILIVISKVLQGNVASAICGPAPNEHKRFMEVRTRLTR